MLNIKTLLYTVKRRFAYFLLGRNNSGNQINKKFPLATIHSNAQVSLECNLEGDVVIGSNASINKCSIGKYSYVAAKTTINYCHIGKFCSIGHDVKIGLGIHPTKKFVSSSPAFYSKNFHNSFVEEDIFTEFQLVEIGNDVWIGDRSLILGGVKIGDGAIIGAGAVVVKDVAPFSIVGGVPAKEIRKRFTDGQINFLLDFRWWDKDEKWLRSNAHLFRDMQIFMSSFES